MRVKNSGVMRVACTQPKFREWAADAQKLKIFKISVCSPRYMPAMLAPL